VNKTVFHAVVVTLVLAGVATAEPAIRLNRKADGGRTTFDVTGLDAADLARLAKTKLEPEQWTALFGVYVDNGNPAERAGQPAVLGAYRVEDGVLRFEPRFPPGEGLRFRAVFDPSKLPGKGGGKQEPVVAEFAIPKPPQTATTTVEQVYPTTATLPENQLKFYLHFSAPMSRGQAYKHIRLLDAAGKPVEDPFLKLGEELWDAQGKRFTLFFDPGRIKRGLKPREDLGPVLEAGKSYTLVVDAPWADAKGNPLKQEFCKAFRVTGPVEEAIDAKAWKLQPPPAEKTAPLTVTFPRPLDHAMLQRVLTVTDAAGQKVAGTVAVGDEETRWQFTPEKPWPAGAYNLVVDTALEDLAGNSIARAFEVDVFHPVQREVKAKTVSLPFTIPGSPPRK
jgi:hypothetical protein